MYSCIHIRRSLLGAMLLKTARSAVQVAIRRNALWHFKPLFGFALLLFLAGCGQPEKPRGKIGEKVQVVEDLTRFSKESIGAPFEGKPWVSHVNVVDLDRDGKEDVLACDDRLNGIVWLRQTAPAKFTESILISGILSPVHVEAVDMDGDQDLDLLVSCMGEVFPNNDKIGAVVILENDGQQVFKKRVIAENISRVTDVRAGDFDGD